GRSRRSPTGAGCLIGKIRRGIRPCAYSGSQRSVTGKRCSRELRPRYARSRSRASGMGSRGKQLCVGVSECRGPGSLRAADVERAMREKVSLCMIVKDEAENLPACLDSVIDLVDELVVVDTGSTDRTPEIARHYGARLVEAPWTDSFAAA